MLQLFPLFFLTLFNNEKEMIGYKKTIFNEMMSDQSISTYKQVKVVPVYEGSVLYGFKYDGNHVNALDENIFDPFKAPVDLDKLELDGEYQALLIKEYKY